MHLEVKNNNDVIYKKEYTQKDKRFRAIYDIVSAKYDFKKLSKIPSSIADYSDGSIALYYRDLPYELYGIFPENAYVYAIKLKTNGEVVYKWYEIGDTADISVGFDILGVGRQVGSDEIKLYSCAGGNGNDIVLWNKSFSCEAYLNGIKINKAYYEKKEN
jgi:hypothetical protein